MVDYSKWKDIEISDDEDDTHPNIDTPSLFRWRHQARIERMEEQKREKEEIEKSRTANENKLKEIKEKINKSEKNGTENLDQLKVALLQLEKEAEEIKKREEEFKKKEKTTPWNVDTIGKPGFAKTVINTAPKPKREVLSEEEQGKRLKEHIAKYEKLMKNFGMLRRYDDSKRFLQEHPELVSEHTANYLVIWCINLEMEEKHDLMKHVAHQCICIQYMLELAQKLDVDPRACVGSFFSKMEIAEEEYKKSFDDELHSFIERIQVRAAEKLKAALAEAEEEERKARLGPGGLDPLEVLETLPPELKKCFEVQDIKLLQETILKMPEQEAQYHMKRCIDSGLWVPDAKKKESTEKETTASDDQ
ncbi:hsp90 co-chaperone Cdc37 [Schistocerca gregaria]|uniref:hsp90 co-chaperone Cdc37 n=1 Tax=Schistocerca gregaria TaxID=7010 RepID=UPI00211E4F14|nr:hsp90 co-chaperone Cdc37 [Schistocerca gregaria]XP_049827084.1 hsp90 co-chaperone Cdc37 [Schistocerca gregaria]XP_049827094.1 hsp90 co-chaperone Cdc37 [Schistocerca gregaria]